MILADWKADLNVWLADQVLFRRFFDDVGLTGAAWLGGRTGQLSWLCVQVIPRQQ